MREHIYKAQRRDNHEWIIGYYCKYGDNHCIIESTEFGLAKGVGIIPETLCEFSGLYDKNGKRIWENDIVEGKFDGLYIILWYPRNAQFIKFSGYDRVPWTDIESMTRQNLINPLLQKDMCSDLKVIGNVIDNPELLTADTE